jgi:hypothetical protein
MFFFLLFSLFFFVLKVYVSCVWAGTGLAPCELISRLTRPAPSAPSPPASSSPSAAATTPAPRLWKADRCSGLCCAHSLSHTTKPLTSSHPFVCFAAGRLLLNRYLQVQYEPRSANTEPETGRVTFAFGLWEDVRHSSVFHWCAQCRTCLRWVTAPRRRERSCCLPLRKWRRRRAVIWRRCSMPRPSITASRARTSACAPTTRFITRTKGRAQRCPFARCAFGLEPVFEWTSALQNAGVFGALRQCSASLFDQSARPVGVVVLAKCVPHAAHECQEQTARAHVLVYLQVQTGMHARRARTRLAIVLRSCMQVQVVRVRSRHLPLLICFASAASPAARARGSESRFIIL